MSPMVQKTLNYIFLDLPKADNTVDQEQLLEILEGWYGVGPNMLGLLFLLQEPTLCSSEWELSWGELLCPNVESPKEVSYLLSYSIFLWMQ